MGKIKFTKGELKRQRDALRRYERYLPILQLKKQQIQMEILREIAVLDEKLRQEADKKALIGSWAGLLSDTTISLRRWVFPKKTVVNSRNVAGLDLPAFDRLEFEEADYDLFITPLWVDNGINDLRSLALLRQEIRIIREAVELLRQELRIATQRVNLFEKVKIPEAVEIIRLIKIYIGDQITNAVGRSKIAKRKIEAEKLSV